MIYELFNFAYAPMIATLIWTIGIGLIGYFFVFRIKLFDVLAKQPIAPPFMSLPAVMFAFLMIFMASAAWQNITLARTSLVNEHSALARMVAVPLEPGQSKQQLHADLRRYLTAVVDEEWKKNFNQTSSAEAEAALGAIETNIWAVDTLCGRRALADTPCASALAVSTLLKALDDLRLAREQRLSLGFTGGIRLKWALALVLAIVTVASIAAVHRSNPRGAVIAISLFCVGTWMAFSVVTLHYQPYRGPDAISPTMLEAVRAKL
jgi:hypothetical protein